MYQFPNLPTPPKVLHRVVGRRGRTLFENRAVMMAIHAKRGVKRLVGMCPLSPLLVVSLAIWLGATACAGTSSWRTERIRADPILASLVDRLGALPSEGYEGGLADNEMGLAEALASHALETGVPRRPCPPDRSLGVLLVSGTPSDRSGHIGDNPVLEALEHFIRGGNRRQRDIALVAVTRIGPGSGFSPAFLQERGAWSREALTAVTCQRWSEPDVYEMWSESTVNALNRLDYKDRARRSIKLMIKQMLDKRFRYPQGVFAYALANRGYGDDLSIEAVSNLLPLLRDGAYATSLRIEAVEMVGELGKAHAIFDGKEWQSTRRLRGQEHLFETDLLQIYEHGPPDLSRAAGIALVEMRSKHGADVLADVIETEGGVWALRNDCDALAHSERLGRALVKLMSSPVERSRIEAIEALGCLRFVGAGPALMEALRQPFWSQQRAAVLALARFDDLPDEARAEIEKLAQSHWSKWVREAAAHALAPKTPEGGTEGDLALLRGFHRRAINHGLPVCHGKTPDDGRYSFGGSRAFDVRWNVAKVHDLPNAFPIKLHEMRERTGYGTNTFLRIDGGWLYSTDLWHYNSAFGFVGDDGEVQEFAPISAHAAFIVRTQLGIAALGEDIFGGGDGGVLATLQRDATGRWSWTPVLELPSEAFAYAFGPDGALLVADPYGAVAITKEREILPLKCE